MRRIAGSRLSTQAKADMRRLRSAWIVAGGLAAALLLALPGTARSAASRAELEERVAQLERQANNQGLIELARQLDALQAEVRALRGSVEELQFSLNGAKEQQKAQYLDLDRRLQAVEESSAKLAANAAAAAPDPTAEYQAAFDLLKSGKYEEARAGFEAFLASHPTHELASNAQYWLGEVAYVGRDYEAALKAFGKVLSDYPQARKAPDALLKTGYCQYEMKRYPQARATLVRLTQEYADAPAARDAAERLARMATEGH
jgi:tol-pal system protein YbgF